MKRRIIIVIVLGVFLSVQFSARAEQRRDNDYAGQIVTGVDGKRVGIGTSAPAATLDVYRGEIKIGSTGVACSKTLAGTLRSENAKLQFCDGASWRNVSLDKAE